MSDSAPVPIDVRVGRRLADARRRAGLTLREVAERLQWPLSTVHNYETGRRPIKLAALEAIAGVLGRTPAALLVDTVEAAAIVEQIAADEERCIQVALFLEHLHAESAPGEHDG